MTKKISILSALLLVCSILAGAAYWHTSRTRTHALIPLPTNHLYASDGVHVFALNPEDTTLSDLIVGADPATFMPYDDEFSGYSKDAKHVYWWKNTVPGANPTTFTVLYSKDLTGRMRESAYGKDSAHVYYRGGLLPDADPATLTLVDIDNSHEGLPTGYVKDAHHVYYNDHMLAGADPKTFVSFDDPDSILNIATDAHMVYFGTTTAPQIDAKTFALVRDQSGSAVRATDATHTYTWDYNTWTFTVVPAQKRK